MNKGGKKTLQCQHTIYGLWEEYLTTHLKNSLLIKNNMFISTIKLSKSFTAGISNNGKTNYKKLVIDAEMSLNDGDNEVEGYKYLSDFIDSMRESENKIKEDNFVK